MRIQSIHTPTFVAEVTDFAPEAPLSDVNRDRLRSALASAGVIVLRGQGDLTRDGFVALCEVFGPARSVADITNVREDGSVMPPGDLETRRALGNSVWHMDNLAAEVPQLGAALAAREIPAGGGGATEFVDLAAAWATLPRQHQRRLRNLETFNTFAGIKRRSGAFTEAEIEDVRSSSGVTMHPAVTVDPLSHAPVLTISGHTEGSDFSEELISHSARFGDCYSHAWQPGDVLVWNDRRVLHRVQPYDYSRVRRRLWRADIEGGPITGYSPTLRTRVVRVLAREGTS